MLCLSTGDYIAGESVLVRSMPGAASGDAASAAGAGVGIGGTAGARDGGAAAAAAEQFLVVQWSEHFVRRLMEYYGPASVELCMFKKKFTPLCAC